MEGDGPKKDALRKVFFRPRNSFSLRMAPMIDLVFLLLIFFLVAVKWRPREDFIPLRLASAQAQPIEIGKPEPLQIYISTNPDGCLVQIGRMQTAQISGQTIEQDLAELMEKIDVVLVSQKRNVSDPIEIICEPDVKSEYWIKICNVFYGMKLTDIIFPMTQWQGPYE